MDTEIPSLDAMSIMDEDDMMEAIRILSQKKEQLMNAIETKSMELDAWYQILGCSTASELEDIDNAFPSLAPVKEMEADLLIEYDKLVTEAQAMLFMDGVMAHELDDGTILVTFMPPPGRKYSKTVKLSLTPNENKTYSVCHHSLPDSFPVQQLAADYLQDNTGEDGKDGVRKFITALSEYTRAFFIRYNHVSILEESKMLSSRIHCSSDCSVVSVLIEMFAEGEVGASQFEFVLRYNLLEIFPQEVDVRFVDGVQTSDAVKEVLEEATVDMKMTPFPNVIAQMFSEPQVTEIEEESGSSDTVIFDFK